MLCLYGTWGTCYIACPLSCLNMTRTGYMMPLAQPG